MSLDYPIPICLSHSASSNSEFFLPPFLTWTRLELGALPDLHPVALALLAAELGQRVGAVAPADAASLGEGTKEAQGAQIEFFDIIPVWTNNRQVYVGPLNYTTAHLKTKAPFLSFPAFTFAFVRRWPQEGPCAHARPQLWPLLRYNNNSS